MRNAMLAILALSAATIATVGGSSPAAAYDYPYCLQGRGIGIPGDCSYTSYSQCMASASGRAAQCVVNPYYSGPKAGRSKRSKRHQQ